jgi:organic radical activating enzyme
MRLALQEIIWEITSQCNNHCEYCGSKEGWGKVTYSDTIKYIADKIAEYPPKEIDISGGDPLVVDYATHEYVVNLLRGRGVKCKILVNPKSIEGENYPILDLYDHVGISINTPEELQCFENLAFGKELTYTVITNFNILNSYMAKSIAEKLPHETIWQIQFTMYRNPDSKEALWNHPVALERLNEDLGSITHLITVMADNCNAGLCGAGLNTMGITATGDVIPCLSMRSWMEDDALQVMGNLLDPDTSLKNLWMDKFKEQRFEEVECCKDKCNHQLITPKPPEVTYDMTVTEQGGMVTPVYGVTFPPQLPLDPNPNVTMYAVTTDPNFGRLAYGVTTHTTTTPLSDYLKKQNKKKEVSDAD